MAMPRSEMYSMLSAGDRIRIAEEDHLYPNFKLWFAETDVEREVFSTALTVQLDDARIAISPIEL